MRASDNKDNNARETTKTAANLKDANDIDKNQRTDNTEHQVSQEAIARTRSSSHSNDMAKRRSTSIQDIRDSHSQRLSWESQRWISARSRSGVHHTTVDGTPEHHEGKETFTTCTVNGQHSPRLSPFPSLLPPPPSRLPPLANAQALCPVARPLGSEHAVLPNFHFSAHGTVQGCCQLIDALQDLTNERVQLKRMPGSGLRRQAKITWTGRRAAINIRCPHVQGKQAASLAQTVSAGIKGASRRPSVSSDAPITNPTGTPPQECSGLCRVSFFSSCGVWVSHVLRVFWCLWGGALSVLFGFLPEKFCSSIVVRSRTPRERIRGVGSQAASRRGAKPVTQPSLPRFPAATTSGVAGHARPRC